ncbi:myelin protein zero-like protein 1 isoform X1 [Malaclemys terrapin pileata]|uniref:myelin protein zero-like protein 1 isoform X1 n=1 Tax=Malaclemys terrapin pileata TaxID=2991368 RepID=UPI0003891342|nr:myelin protein zero-like protein 1 isoform X1 [Chrysemys picta bellii]XP_053902266.1 myelin protein zero-like protein 1 isoform X1 [Malaclemys terrapin pileata]
MLHLDQNNLLLWHLVFTGFPGILRMRMAAVCAPSHVNLMQLFGPFPALEILLGQRLGSEAERSKRLLRTRILAIRVSALDVKTPEELFVENGTEARLPCTFSSRDVISSAASISWSFQPEGATTPISFFYYSQGNAYPGKDTPFKNRISWAGDLNKKDASVSIANVQFRDNGTYFCDVKNPPDIVVKPGEIRLRVVQRDNLPAFPTGMVVAIAIGVTLVVLLLIAIIVCVVRKKNSKKHYSGCSTSESLMSPVKQAPRKSPSDTEGLVNHVPARLHQGPVIYAQLDHSGGQHSDKINKSESVVYADIRKN